MPTALWRAVRLRQTQAVIDLIAQDVELNAIVGDQNETPLSLAARFGPLQIFELLLNAGADPSIRDRDNGRNALHTHLSFFNQTPRIEYVRLLCAVNLDINARDRRGETALYYAIKWSEEYGPTDILDFLLLQKNCEIDTCDIAGDTPLVCAIRLRHFDKAECLITHGADFNLFTKEYGRWGTPLHHCVYLLNDRGVRFLLRQGADETLTDRNGRTPFEFATNGQNWHAARAISEELHTRKLRVLAFMSGTHTRLGELSWIRALDAELVIDFIVRRYLPW